MFLISSVRSARCFVRSGVQPALVSTSAGSTRGEGAGNKTGFCPETAHAFPPPAGRDLGAERMGASVRVAFGS